MSSIYYLYIKTHNQTGLKYLGKTTKNPLKYKGSGKYWLRHIKKHGYDVTTEIIFQSYDFNEFKTFALDYSTKNNIVEGNEWANLMPETGTGGNNPLAHTEKAKTKSKQTRKLNNKTWKRSQEANFKSSLSLSNYWKSTKAQERKKKDFIGPPKPPGWFKNNNSKHTCPHCNKTGDLGNMKRWHFDNCKLRPQ